MTKDDRKAMDQSAGAFASERLHEWIFLNYIGLLLAMIVAALIRADLAALFGCSLGGLLHSLIWSSDE